MIIIPARLASTRMPNKILREINGVPMFVATARRVSAADEPENIVKFREFCEKNAERAFMFSCFKFIGSELADDKNLVKVVTDDAGYALYFSRSRIPFDRAPFDAYKAHLGIYGYSVKSLKEFCTLATSSLENTEKLEQLRALENGKKIAMLEVESQSIGIDSEEDYQRALAKFGKK